MSEPFARLRRFLRELKRRNVYRVAVAYLGVAFVGFQAMKLLIPSTTLPTWADELILAFLITGFPVTLVVAWAFELTPEGVRPTGPAGAPGEDREPGERSAPDAPPARDGLRRAPGQLAMKVLLGLGLVAAAGAGGWYFMERGGQRAEIAEETVAVLPFQVSGSGAETWRDGMVTMLNTGLDGAAGLRAIADRTVFAAWSEARGRGEGATTEEALAVAREIGAQYAVVGSAVQVGGELRLVAEVHATRSGQRLGRAVVRGAADSVTALADSLTRRTLGFLVEEGTEGIPSVDMATKTTSSLPALRSFLAGERHLRAGEYDAAIDRYRSAVGSDTAFALAHARLALSYWWAGEPTLEREAWRRAEAFADRLPRRERRLVRALHLARTRGRSGWGADSLRRLTDSYPDDPTVWYSLGEILWHEDVPGGWPEADTAFARAVELDPGHALYYPHYAQLAIAVHHDSALSAQRIAEMPEPEWREFYRIPHDLAFGDSAAVRAALARLDSVPLSEMLGVGPRYALRHPEEGDAYVTVLEKILGRAGSDRWRSTGLRLFRASLAWGRIGAARSWLDTLAVVDDGRIGCYLSASLTLGLPVPDSLVRSYLEPADLPDGASRDRIRCAGIYLIETGRAGELNTLLPRIREAARSAGEDSVAQGVEAAMEEVMAYRAWKAGDPELAARLFPGASRTGRAGSIWRGDVHRELGQLEQAERWYRAAWTHPVAHERLGRLYEEMGRPEEAAAAYRRFIEAWADADAELQGRVEAARERVRELSAPEVDVDD